MPKLPMTSGFRTSSGCEPSTTAPAASSSWPGAPILRTSTRSSGASSRAATSTADRHAAPRQRQHHRVGQVQASAGAVRAAARRRGDPQTASSASPDAPDRGVPPRSAVAAQHLAGEVERAADQDVVGRRLLRNDRVDRGRERIRRRRRGRRAGPPWRPKPADRGSGCRRAPARSAGSPRAGPAAPGTGRDPWSSACRPRDATPGRARACPGSRPALGRPPGCDHRPARAWCRAARARSADPGSGAAGGPASAPPSGHAPIDGARQPGLRRAAAPPSSRARHCRSGARLPAAAAADRAARAGLDGDSGRGRVDGPVAAVHQQWRADLGRTRLDHRQRLRPLRPDHRGHAGLEDAGLLEGDLAPACRRESSHGPSRPA